MLQCGGKKRAEIYVAGDDAVMNPLSEKMRGKTVLLTGAGGGIGYEAAKAFAAMGGHVIVADIQKEKAEQAAAAINAQFSAASASSYVIDLADEAQIHAMADWMIKTYGVPDVVFNNAAMTIMGAVDQVESAVWDQSYAVNLRAPLILAQRFLPFMKARASGTIVFVSSSGAAPYMGAYEVFKTAQVELSSTLSMELEDSGVYVYTIGPGLVKTETAMRSIEIVAKQMGMTTEAFYQMNEQHIVDAEKAGWGFALSAAFSQRYHGQEIGCVQVLADFDMFISPQAQPGAEPALSAKINARRAQQLIAIHDTFEQQLEGWKKMNVFERQWVLRDFKKKMGLSAEQAADVLGQLRANIEHLQGIDSKQRDFFEKLKVYWEHQLQLLRSYEKDKAKLEENTGIITGWIQDICDFLA